ncbi:TIGR03545 family protein [Litoribacillus peritrichatus]|uniref:TIGR03545 family protein n=1 Tax=Litoribacillus peritrichatus TaxID=718191 RepID=A0ABP7NBU5_9GAMM
MKGMIRWSGLGVAAVLVILAYFVIEPLLKFVIEQAGTRALSTKVSLHEVSVDWAKPSLALTGLEVADKKQPMRNQLEVDEISVSIDAFEALSGHLISDQAKLKGIQFNTERTTSGEIGDIVTLDNVDDKVTESAGEALSLPGLDLPDIDELVKKENSLTYQRYQALKQYVDANKEAFKQRIDALKDEKKIDDYKARFKEIKSAKGFMGKLKMVSKAKDLKEDIDGDLKEAKQLRKDFDKTVAEIKRRVAELKDSPKQEADHLLHKVGVEGGTDQVAQMLFGPELKGYLKQLKEMTSGMGEAKASEPEEVVVERGKGIFVRFDQERPQPLVWFKKAEVSGDFSGLGVPFGFNGTASDITDQQKLTDKPTSLDLKLLNDQVKSADLAVSVDLRKQSIIALETNMQGYQVDKLPLSGDFELSKGLADIVAKIKTQDEQLSGTVNMDMSAVSLTSTGDMFEKYPSAKDALASISNIDADATLSGSLDQPGVAIKSNLDDVLSSVLNKALEGQLATYKAEVTERLDAMLQDELSDADTIKADYLGMSGDIDGTKKLLNDLLGGL